MSELVRLIATPMSLSGEVRFQVTFAAHASEASPDCAAAVLSTGDGQTYTIGQLCAPTAVTWREQRVADLVTHTYRGTGPHTATLTWGAIQVQMRPQARDLAQPAAAAVTPAVSLFLVAAVTDQPFQRLIKLRVEHLAAGHSLRLDGGAGQVRMLTHEGGASQAVELALDYAKPGSYTVTLDLLDSDSFWLATLAETPIEISPAEEEAEAAPMVALPAVTAEAAATVAGSTPWLPYRNIRPTRSVATYTSPGGGTVRRTVNTGYFLTARAETIVGGKRWFQTALGDWISADVVTFFVPSEFQGVALDTVSPPPPPPPPGRRGIITADALNVRAAPGVSAGNPPIATLRAGAEVIIYEERVVAGATWYRIGENRWVHGGYVRIIADPIPTPTPPPSPAGRRGIVTADVLNVRAAPGVSAGNPPIATLRAGAEVTIYEERTVAGALWYRIGEGRWVAGSWVRVLDTNARSPAPAATRALPSQLPLGWVVATTLSVRAAPGVSASNPPISQLGHYARVAILEQRTVAGVRWFRIGEGQWIEGRQVGVARVKARPASIGASTRWVGVCLSEQTFVAYEGDRPVFAGLTASGLPGTPTVQGIFHTWRRLDTGKMSGPGYYIEDVTWTCYFYSGYALHTAYWHDKFGTTRSHGCVNLSPHDAWWIYQWSAADGANSPTVYSYWA